MQCIVRFQLIILFSIFTSIAIAAEGKVASDKSCNSNYILGDNQWVLISLPCYPGENNTVTDIFGDDVADAFVSGNPSYGTDWSVYTYDSVNSSYVKLNQNDILNVGVGYWIIQKSGSSVTLDLPASSTTPISSRSSSCSSDKGCLEIPLVTKPGDMSWNLIGSSIDYSSKLKDTRIKTTTANCKQGCDLIQAENEAIIQKKFWTYNGLKYELLDGQNNNFEPWLGYWVISLVNSDGSNPKILIPTSDTVPVVGPIAKEHLKTMIKNGEDVTQVDTSQITDMSNLFSDNSTFNQNISGWDVSKVTSMEGMFISAVSFNQDISTWNVSKVKNMHAMFFKATSFNQDISGWDVSNVTIMEAMFYRARGFTNQDLSDWNVLKVNRHDTFFLDTGANNTEPKWIF